MRPREGAGTGQWEARGGTEAAGPAARVTALRPGVKLHQARSTAPDDQGLNGVSPQIHIWRWSLWEATRGSVSL